MNWWLGERFAGEAIQVQIDAPNAAVSPLRMAATPSARQSIHTIRELISSPPDKKASDGNSLFFPIHHLGTRWEELVKDPSLMTEVLEVAEEILKFRGKGSQGGARHISQLFGLLVMRLVECLPEFDTTFGSFAEARNAIPSASATWDALEKFAARASACIQGPPSRSRHTDRLRSDAWMQLGTICGAVSDPTALALALEIAANPRLTANERENAVNFLPEFWGDDEPDESTKNLLTSLENEPPSRAFLITVLQAQIQLGLNDNLGAMFAADDWDDADEEE